VGGRSERERDLGVGGGDVVVGIVKLHDTTYIPGFSTDSEVLMLLID
jgi:hypothetical protein